MTVNSSLGCIGLALAGLVVTHSTPRSTPALRASAQGRSGQALLFWLTRAGA